VKWNWPTVLSCSTSEFELMAKIPNGTYGLLLLLKVGVDLAPPDALCHGAAFVSSPLTPMSPFLQQ
jgi:hypothetical protein